MYVGNARKSYIVKRREYGCIIQLPKLLKYIFRIFEIVIDVIRIQTGYNPFYVTM